MKKPLIYTSIIGIVLALSTIITFGVGSSVNSLNADKKANTEKIIGTVSETTSKTKLNLNNPNQFSKEETVYVINNHDGTVNKSFIGNVINTSDEPLPIEMHITYELDGKEIPAGEINGKTGHIKITYNFAATKTKQNKLVPFLTVTGLTFNKTKFSNFKINNGKIVSESDNIMVAGYTFAGLNQDLGTNFLPEDFSVEADADSFELSDVYTFATNEFFSDIDTSKLTSIDGLINSINDLSAALNQIIAGSSKLSGGAIELANGASKLASSAKELASKASDLANGADKLAGGLNQIVEFNDGIINKIDTTTDEVVAVMKQIAEKYQLSPDIIEKITAPIVEYYNKAYTAITTYTGNIEQISNGVSELSIGVHKLANGASGLSTGIAALSSGANELANGSETLYSGLTTFKTQGIDRLVNFANNDLDNFLMNLRSTVTASKNYTHYTNPSAQNVRFIFKVPAIK